MLSDHIKASSAFTHTLRCFCEVKGCDGEVVLTAISEVTREHLYGDHAWPCHCNACGTLYVSNCKLPLIIKDEGSPHRFNLSLHTARMQMTVIRLNNNRLD